MGRRERAVFGGLLTGIGEGMLLKSSNRQKDEIANRKAIIDSLKESSKGAMTDSQEFDRVVSSHTTEGMDGKSTDWPAVIKIFEKSGRQDFVEMARQGEKPVDINSPEYLAAEESADAWIDAQAGWFSPDSSDFKDYGGNREQARQAKVREFLQGGSGATGTTGAAGTTGSSLTSAGQYSTAEDVGQAFQDGKISQQEAERILRDQFGYQ